MTFLDSHAWMGPVGRCAFSFTGCLWGRYWFYSLMGNDLDLRTPFTPDLAGTPPFGCGNLSIKQEVGPFGISQVYFFFFCCGLDHGNGPRAHTHAHAHCTLFTAWCGALATWPSWRLPAIVPAFYAATCFSVAYALSFIACSVIKTMRSRRRDIQTKPTCIAWA